MVSKAAFTLSSLQTLPVRQRQKWLMGGGGGGVGRGRERGRIPSRLCTVSPEPDAGLEPTNREIMTWAETKSRTLNRLSHPGAPIKHFFLKDRVRHLCHNSTWKQPERPSSHRLEYCSAIKRSMLLINAMEQMTLKQMTQVKKARLEGCTLANYISGTVEKTNPYEQKAE